MTLTLYLKTSIKETKQNEAYNQTNSDKIDTNLITNSL